MKRTTVATYAVKMTMPVGSNAAQLQQYIRDAIRQWAKGGDPENPLFELKDEDFTVRLIKKETTYG